MTSYRFSISPKSRTVGRFLGRVRRELQRAFAEEKRARNLTQAEIARALGVDRAVVNRQLMGTENIGLRRVAEFAWVLGRDLHFSLEKPSLPIGSNADLRSEPQKEKVPSSSGAPSAGTYTAAGVT